MKKQEFLEFLKESLKIEEDIIPLYSYHISNTLFLSGLAPDKVKTVAEILNVLKSDSERHRDLFQQLIKRVKESSQDVY